MRALRISLLLQSSLHVLWVGRLCLLLRLIEVHEAGTALKCLTIKVRLFILYFFFPLPHFPTNSLRIGAELPVGSLIFWCEIWWNESDASVFPQTCTFCPTLKLIRALLASPLQIIPGWSWINSHFCPAGGLHLSEGNMKRISSAPVEKYNVYQCWM